jgi:preprotein translocase subunit SecG
MGAFLRGFEPPPGAKTETSMIVLITIIHVLVCAFLIIVVLLQHGQSADIAAAFGGAGSQTAFGARTAGTVLSRATTYAAIAFMVTSITLSVLATRRGVSSGSVLGNTKSAPAQKAPAPAPLPASPSR